MILDTLYHQNAACAMECDLFLINTKNGHKFIASH